MYTRHTARKRLHKGARSSDQPLHTSDLESRDTRAGKNRLRLLTLFLLLWAFPLFGWLALPRGVAEPSHSASAPDIGSNVRSFGNEEGQAAPGPRHDLTAPTNPFFENSEPPQERDDVRSSGGGSVNDVHNFKGGRQAFSSNDFGLSTGVAGAHSQNTAPQDRSSPALLASTQPTPTLLSNLAVDRPQPNSADNLGIDELLKDLLPSAEGNSTGTSIGNGQSTQPNPDISEFNDVASSVSEPSSIVLLCVSLMVMGLGSSRMRK